MLASSIPAAAAPSADLSAKQVATLDGLGVRVALPTYTPPGYRLDEVLTTPCKGRARRSASEKCATGPDYIVRFRKGSAWYAFEETAGDIGPTSLTYKTYVKTEPFGAVPLRFGQGIDGIGVTPSPAQMNAVQNELYCDWIGSGPYYHVIGERMPPAVMVKILSSVEWVSNG